MKLASLEQLDTELAKLADAQARAAAGLRSRIESAEATLARFANSPTEQDLAAAHDAQGKLDALKKIQAEMPDPVVREAELRDRFIREHKAALVEFLERDLAERVKALGARSQPVSGRSYEMADETNAAAVQSERRCLAANGALSLFKTEPNFTNLMRARDAVATLGQL